MSSFRTFCQQSHNLFVAGTRSKENVSVFSFTWKDIKALFLPYRLWRKCKKPLAIVSKQSSHLEKHFFPNVGKSGHSGVAPACFIKLVTRPHLPHALVIRLQAFKGDVVVLLRRGIRSNLLLTSCSILPDSRLRGRDCIREQGEHCALSKAYKKLVLDQQCFDVALCALSAGMPGLGSRLSTY